jgi:hypothetical protein
LDSPLIEALAGLVAGLMRVRKESLPTLPSGWPRDEKNSRAFLQAFARLAEAQVIRPNWREYGGLFAVLGVPVDGLAQFVERVPAMARRPFSLLQPAS